METYLLDTNILIRFLKQDHPTMGRATESLFQAAARGEVRLIIEESILAEAVYVLQTIYKEGRVEISEALQALLRRASAGQAARPAILYDALERFRRHPQVDFADALLAASAADQDIPVASFDRDFDRFADVVRFKPPSV